MAEDGVIDLARRQRAKLEAESNRLRASNAELVAMAKANLAAQAQTHSAVLSVLEADTLPALDRKLAGPVASALSVDLARIFIEGHDPLPSGQAIRSCSPGLVTAMLGARPERLGPVDARYADALYAAKASSLRSDALVRLDMGRAVGVLCLASRDGAAFHTGQGADLLHFFARVMERRLRPWLDA
jgi:uncharacterized protein YigA (DUF484 family)